MGTQASCGGGNAMQHKTSQDSVAHAQPARVKQSVDPYEVDKAIAKMAKRRFGTEQLED